MIAAVVAVTMGTGLIVTTPGARRVLRVAEVPVTAMDQSLAPANNSPALAVDPTDERFAVVAHRRDAPDFGCGLQVSGDAGTTWSSALPVRKLPRGAEKCYAPEIAFDRQGVLYYLFVGLAGLGNRPMGVFLTTSMDRGRSFSPPRRLLGPLNFGVRMVIDGRAGTPGRMHLVWLHAGSVALGGFASAANPILAAHSDDGGRTLSKPVQVSDRSRLRAVALLSRSAVRIPSRSPTTTSGTTRGITKGSKDRPGRAPGHWWCRALWTAVAASREGWSWTTA